MGKNLAMKFSAVAMLAFAIVLITGCSTTKPIDWDSRVGTYTYDQAVTDLGPPDKQAKLTDGNTVASWITHRYGGTSVGFGTGFYSGGGGSAVGVGVGHSVGSGYPDKVLTLTFGPDHKLVTWTKNY